MNEDFKRLMEIAEEIADLQSAAGLLGWDEQTYMPPGAAKARAEQKTTLGRLIHDRITDDEVGELLERLEEATEDMDPASREASTVRVVRRHYDRETKVPSDLVERLSRATSAAFHSWVKAREEDDFAIFQPHLETIVELQQEKADALGYEDHPYDALLDLFEPGMTTDEVEAVFSNLRDHLVPLVDAISEQLDTIDASFLQRNFPDDAQWEFTLEVLEEIGFDMERGRQDRSEHPFTTSFSTDDVRVTTRIGTHQLGMGLFATIHEAGHGMYEQGFPGEYDRTPLAGSPSMGVHESQSRMWENVVGRSRVFWEYFYPELQRRFPSQLEDVSLADFYRSVNRVEPSFIRVEADEVTYNLHIMLRFELEQLLLTGELDVQDAPAAWNAKMEDYLGITPRGPSQGILQDIHWSHGMFGYFPTYSLGTILSVQFYNEALADHPEMEEEFRQGDFSTLLEWLHENVHAHGSKFKPQELVKRVTGESLSTEPYLNYMQEKFGEIYDLG